MRLFATILLASAALCQAAPTAAGRWEGTAQIPGHELRLIVDLSDEGGKGWLGSIILPDLGVKGAPLVDLQLRGADVTFAIKGALGNERAGRAELKAHLSADGKLAGEFTQGGNRASFALEKTGPPQSEREAQWQEDRVPSP